MDSPRITNDPDLKDPIWRLTHLYLIRTKDSTVTRLEPNRVQRLLLADIRPELDAGLPVRNMTLKFRQGGVSTFFLLLHLDRTIFTPNVTTGILADLRENLGYLFEIVRFAHESMPDVLRPRLGSDSKTELTFPDIGSKIMVSLEIKSTTLHGLHVSEYAHMEQDDVERTLGACAPDAWVTKESTANGRNFYWNRWLESKGSKKPGIFLPWPLQEEYRIPKPGESDNLPPVERTKDEARLADDMRSRFGIEMDDRQIRYRREKQVELGRLFKQEMAESEDECFLSTGGAFFDGAKVEVLLKEARQHLSENPLIKKTEDMEVWESPQPRHVYVAGADVAEGVGGDYSVLAILCVNCRRTAARYSARVAFDSFYRLCHRMGMEYNRAHLAVERNNQGHAIILGLKEAGYPNLYHQRKANRLSGAYNELKFGWDTNAESKPRMMYQLKQALEGNSEEDAEHFQPDLKWLDVEFLKQTFNIIEEGVKISAVSGKHDDLVVAYAIAYQLFREARGSTSIGDVGRIWLGERLESA